MTKTQSERSQKWRASPKGKYAEQKRHAKQRGVPFKLTFPQWWGIWTRSGHWDQRGNTAGCYCMCRKGDEGAYEIHNVYIGTWSQNTVERNKVLAARRRLDPLAGTPILGDEAPF